MSLERDISLFVRMKRVCVCDWGRGWEPEESAPSCTQTINFTHFLQVHKMQSGNEKTTCQDVHTSMQEVSEPDSRKVKKALDPFCFSGGSETRLAKTFPPCS